VKFASRFEASVYTDLIHFADETGLSVNQAVNVLLRHSLDLRKPAKKEQSRKQGSSKTPKVDDLAPFPGQLSM